MDPDDLNWMDAVMKKVTLPADTDDPVREVLRQLVVRARSGMIARPDQTPETIENLLDEFHPLLDFLYFGP